ncbi:MAG: hypothetical protein MUQ75_07720 [Crocinitomicaceae bacterium]|nr:hypothetical protein [Crocinitomicaceae bacterium]
MSNDEDDFYFSGPRDYDEQTDSFCMDLENLIYRYVEEYDLNTITIIGALQAQVEQLSNSGIVEFEVDDDFFDEDLD